MKAMKSFKINDTLLNKIISVAYGDASLFDKIRFFFLAKKYSEVKNLLDVYRDTASSVHSIPIDECPQIIVEQVGESINRKSKSSNKFLFDLYSAFFSRPAVSIAATIIVLITMATSILFYKHEPNNIYSQNEIELANYQAKEALAMVGSIFSKTSRKIGREILPNTVSKPIRDGMKIVNNIFEEEQK